MGDTYHTVPGDLHWRPGRRPVRRGGHSEFALLGPQERQKIGIRVIVERLPQSDQQDYVDSDHARQDGE